MTQNNKFQATAAIMLCTLIIAAAALFVGVTTIGELVSASNNTSIKTFVNVTNTEPKITSLTISPSPIDLGPGNITTVMCNATVWDYNGWQDAIVRNGTLFYTSGGFNFESPDSNNTHYSNTSCAICQQSDSATNASCYCKFPVQYYADNGTWTCNLTIGDKGGLLPTETPQNFTDAYSTTVAIAPLVAIDLPGIVNFGNLTVTQTSSLKNVNITNLGNRNINISLYGYGGENQTDGFNLSMRCPLGNISSENERYSFADDAVYSTMSIINSSPQNTGAFINRISNVTQAIKNATNSTYWRLKVPLTVGGFCNGTLVFIASDSLWN